ncbi:MAG: hypothetical protein IT515_11865 [Burkholderiales bacterium]|nr:hypothetical protein [Burkholderiales bacterium]
MRRTSTSGSDVLTSTRAVRTLGQRLARIPVAPQFLDNILDRRRMAASPHVAGDALGGCPGTGARSRSTVPHGLRWIRRISNSSYSR